MSVSLSADQNTTYATLIVAQSPGITAYLEYLRRNGNSRPNEVGTTEAGNSLLIIEECSETKTSRDLFLAEMGLRFNSDWRRVLYLPQLEMMKHFVVTSVLNAATNAFLQVMRINLRF